MLYSSQTRTLRAAFTLVEIAVVVAILALLIGGVVMGQNMLKSQRLRQVSTDANGHIIAFHQFKLKYGEIPGDFSGATALWGRADGVAGSGNCATPQSTQSLGKTTCNGDGDGMLTWNDAGFQYHEHLRAWQHLALAEMIAGRFNGSSGTWGAAFDSGQVTIPALRYSEGVFWSPTRPDTIPEGPQLTTRSTYSSVGYVWLFGYALVDNALSADTYLYDGDYTNALAVVPRKKRDGNWVTSYSVTPADASQIDQKNDDGYPATGFIRSTKNDANCVSGSTSDATYVYSGTTVACMPIFMTGMKGNGQR